MSKTLGIILAAGRSSRLYPATLVNSKQLLPIYDKPLIYYPLTTLMLAGIRDFIVIVNPIEKVAFSNLFRDCKNLMGINVTIATQDYPKGIADAFRIAEFTLHKELDRYDRVALILGDNIFYGSSLTATLNAANQDKNNANIFATRVIDPERFGIVEVSNKCKAISIEEKPLEPKSNLAVTGLYYYPMDVFDVAYRLQPSDRGELEITDVNKVYLENNKLTVSKMLRGMVWFDTGTSDSMLEASQFIQTLQKRQNIIVGSPHEVAYNSGWIDRESLLFTAKLCIKSDYGQYLLTLGEDK